MPARERTKSDFESGYRIKKDTGTVTINTRKYFHAYCEDVTKSGDNQPFRVETWMKHGGKFDGESESTSGHRWVDCPVQYFDIDPYVTDHISITDDPSLAECATMTLRRTNPSRSSVEGIVALAELREIPGLIKESYAIALNKLFKHIPKRLFRNLSRAAKLNLLIQFGILPLLGDLNTCLGFQALVDQRVREIERLRTRGLRRTVELWRGSKRSTVNNELVNSSLITARADIHKVTTLIIRGHVRWRVTDNFYESEADTRARARDIVLGNVVDPSTIYELLPWSWLVDYFTNLGSFISAHRNQLDTTHTTPRIMREARTVCSTSDESTSNSGVKMSPFRGEVVWKTRRVVTAAITARTDFLNPSQWSILASLSVLKSRR